MMGDRVNQLAVEAEDHGEHAVAQPCDARDDGVEDRLDVGRGAADHPEDLARCGLLLERFGQITVPRLQLLEQAHVLDGDDCLIGERRHEIDLLLGEGTDFAPPHDQSADWLAATQQGDRQGCAVAQRVALDGGRRVCGIGAHIVDVHDPLVENGAAGRHAARGRRRERGCRDFLLLPGRPDEEHRERHDPPVVPDHVRERRIAEPHGALHDGLENRPNVGLGPGHDPEDVAGGGLAIERLGQLLVASLDLATQALVLESDRRLVGEGPEERDLLGRERSDARSPDRDQPDRKIVSQKRDDQERAEPLPGDLGDPGSAVGRRPS